MHTLLQELRSARRMPVCDAAYPLTSASKYVIMGMCQAFADAELAQLSGFIQVAGPHRTERSKRRRGGIARALCRQEGIMEEPKAWRASWCRRVYLRLMWPFWRFWSRVRFVFTGWCGFGCGPEEPFGFVPEAGCPIHDYDAFV